MRTRTAAATAAVVTTLILTGCSSGGDGGGKPSPTGTPAAAEKAETTRRCVDAIAERAAANRGGAVRSHPVPEPCARLSDADYLDAYLKGLEQAHRDARDPSPEESGNATGDTGS
ncbi:hypothetical protein AB0G77_28015 [Streptomyces hygroscopicus]|uniref:hypothetical protein n=1 Tax=Streptomyces hygroscopicus TaxID=1912 RepID=UPI0033FDC3CD